MEGKKIYKYIVEQKKQRKKYGQILQRHKNVLLTEQDFYPPSDDRVWVSNIEDIEDGDNFIDYCKEFFDMLDEEEYFDNE